MPELRQNLATKEWVIISTERARRPEDFIEPDRERVDQRPEYVANCPFCPGNEEIELEKLRIPAEGDWQVRVVRNKFPALQEEGPRVRQSEGVNRSISGVGYHEVLIESRRHNTCPALQRADEIERTLMAFRMRGQALNQDPRIEQIIYFKNHGPSAGTSLAHPHTQLLALPVVPFSIRARMEEARRYFDDQGTCVICTMREEEARDGQRIIVNSDHFSAFIPYAAYSPFHIWIIPRRHSPSLLDATPEEIRDLSVVLRDVLRRLYYGLNDPDYNYVIRSAPKQEFGSPYIHWYVSIVTRISRTAGFELGSGMFINTSMPEESARFLREVRAP